MRRNIKKIGIDGRMFRKMRKIDGCLGNGVEIWFFLYIKNTKEKTKLYESGGAIHI